MTKKYAQFIKESAKRRALVLKLSKDHSQVAIGLKLGITRQRVGQLLAQEKKARA